MNFLDYILLNKFQIIDKTIEHIGLALTSVSISLLIGLPLGILITRIKKITGLVLTVVNVIQTIPSLALLGFLLPLFGIGPLPAIIALFLYALLPIVKNAFVGIKEVDPSIKEAGRGMGMSDLQLLSKVELPLAIPTIFVGIRTATVLNIGIATLCALIAAGGLGEFIFRGIALNNTNMILAGAIPAALLAISFDFVLGIIQKFIKQIIKPLLILVIILFFAVVPFILVPKLFHHGFLAGFVPEFMERTDGYPGLKKYYGLNLKIKELDSQLMFLALRDKKVDLIAGYSTEGRIKAYNFQILEDDKKFFPPYYACPIAREEIIRKYPALKSIFAKIAGKISNEKMTEMNYKVEYENKSPKDVARDFLVGAMIIEDQSRQHVIARSKATKQSHKSNMQSEIASPEFTLNDSEGTRNDNTIIIGSKNFTEQYILAEIFKGLIEGNSDLNVDLKVGLLGTKFCFDALQKGEIDIYPEYTGTAYFVILKSLDRNAINRVSTEKILLHDKNKLYSYVKNESKKRFDVEWLEPLGFNNTWTLIMRKDDAIKLDIRRISDINKISMTRRKP